MGVMRRLGGELLCLSAVLVISMKMCKYHPQKRCFHSSCDLIDGMGNISLCSLFEGGHKFTPRSVKLVHISVFSKHLRGCSVHG
jgi:hypothetical protein